LFPLAAHVVLTEPRQPRAISAKLLEEMTEDLAAEHEVIADPREALERGIALAEERGGVVFATGSLFLVGDLRAYGRSEGSELWRQLAAQALRRRWLAGAVPGGA